MFCVREEERKRKNVCVCDKTVGLTQIYERCICMNTYSKREKEQFTERENQRERATKKSTDRERDNVMGTERERARERARQRHR